MFAQVIRGKVTDREGLERQIARWEEDVRPGATGFLGSTGGVTADDRLFVLVRFESAEAAQRNSARAEQSTWWAETEKCLEQVSFVDSEDVVLLSGGGSDDARFVQVMVGRILDQAAYDRMMQQMTEGMDELTSFRPEILGGVTVRWDGDRYADCIYFTSEAEAREGEQKEMPESMQEQFADMTTAVEVEEYLDLTNPVLQ